MISRTRRAWARVAVMAGLALVLTSMRCGIRDDELMCEEASARLESCCDNFVAKVHDCSRWTACGTTHVPDLDLDTSGCIIARSCDELRTSGVCKAALQSTGSLSGVCR